ncbi:phosphoribosylformylglycinamidine synthase I [Methanococcus aeolicus]|jgi:phosphoribosylformylglycinamidine synthase|uniref:Phosphoribosylformylglycinamidine synthase subunit PurQ n=1 Tax=Methanococcus aeolicus (strain ATCC BAA-1280 / DSM 17508 / OCM 812 / Nankai-3) TaxID=419665 RepID=A6UUU0_META3|nr:phosphoribosylformylglycinamidine synthase I [Methanococcus aeolicus]ABR56262.1 phosphoribosylformylglycinamidine synthase I [Methanococcus aeolicus Nankai-3]UXM84273.1 phosphoribosylformylglycinamidine synthase I [Methanococcus aeolicus]
MDIAVAKFLGTNCDNDVCHAIKLAGGAPHLIWFSEKNIDNYAGAVIPGGFSYGDYLRAGAISSKTPIVGALKKMVDDGKPVLGICNGAQIGLEAGFSYGTLTNNESARFICKWVYIRVENNNTPFTKYYNVGDVLKIPVAHAEGRFYADEETLQKMYEKNMIVFKYCDEHGNITEEANPNGSVDNIAGVCNEKGNCVLLMPHPERASEELLGSDDGLNMFKSMINK